MLGPLSLNPLPLLKLKLKSCLYHLIRYTDCILFLLVFWNVPVKSSHGPLWKVTNNYNVSKLKHANVVSLNKGEHKTDPCNYRPISLFFVYDSIFAKTMYRRLMAYLEINGIFCSSQYVFREKHSTEHALIDVVNQISFWKRNALLWCFHWFKKAMIRLTIAFYHKNCITMAFEVLSMTGSVLISLITIN